MQNVTSPLSPSRLDQGWSQDWSCTSQISPQELKLGHFLCAQVCSTYALQSSEQGSCSVTCTGWCLGGEGRTPILVCRENQRKRWRVNTGWTRPDLLLPCLYSSWHLGVSLPLGSERFPLVLYTFFSVGLSQLQWVFTCYPRPS